MPPPCELPVGQGSLTLILGSRNHLAWSAQLSRGGLFFPAPFSRDRVTIARLYSADSVAKRYADLSDEELSALAKQMSSLTEQAASALRNEIDRRGLQSIGGNASEAADSRVPRRTTKHVPISLLAWMPRGVWPFVHLAIAAAFLPTAIQYFIYDLFPALRVFWLPLFRHFTLLTLPFFPLHSLIAFFVGYAAGHSRHRFWGDRSAEEGWIYTSLMMLFMLFSYRPASLIDDDVWHHYFWPAHYSISAIQLVTTVPFLMSVAYSLGHFVGRKRRVGL